MKHIMQPRNTILRETSSSETTSSPNPSSMKQRSTTPSRKPKWSKENTPPSDPVMADSSSSSPSVSGKTLPVTPGKSKSHLPPRPPSSNPLKRKNIMETVPENAVPGVSDSGVQVVVRMRPPNKEEEGEMIVKKISNDSLVINGQTFTFDSVADTEATQLDIFQLVGAPLVENCLAGFNSSVFAYGQTGSGKTFTIWGPANALLEKNLSSDQQGLTPRVFERLFSRINEEQIKHADKQLKYQCRCSFLEIYNEQITDLLDSNQKNLQIREDVKSGVYVENLTEDCVSTMKDVTQLLTKGLSNRRTGATSINADSSRSHSVFTCVVESQCKITSNGMSSFKTSRINLVDLAGSERQKSTGAAGDRLKEAGNINRSLSQLGNLINILAEVSQTGKQRHIPYRDSRLTFLLQESLGGNAKLAMVCAISPSQSCKSETFSTLRFAQRAKAIKNKAVVNEVMQDDVNSLREVIRQLKDELLRMKANGSSADSNGGYSSVWNARRSLNLLKFSLNRPMTLPHVDDDGDEEMEIDEEESENCALSDLHLVASREGTHGEPIATESEPRNEQSLDDTDVVMEEEQYEQIDKQDNMTVDCEKSLTNHPDCSKANVKHSCNQMEGIDKEDRIKITVNMLDGEKLTEERKLLICSDNKLPNDESPSKQMGDNNPYLLSTVSEISADISAADASNYSQNGSAICDASLNLSIVPCDVSPIKSPTPSVSPKVNDSRKSLRTSSMLVASRTDLMDGGKFDPDAVHISFAKSIKSSASNALAFQKSKNFRASTEKLAASLHRGREVIDSHRQSSALRRSSFRFSLLPADYKPILVVDKVNIGVQTLSRDNEISEDDSAVFLCRNCKLKNPQLELREANDSSNLQLVTVEGSEATDKSQKQVPKAVEKVLAGAIRREMALEEFCSKQTAEIMQLNRLVQQYRHERECNAIIGQMREDKIIRLESLMDGVLPTEDFMEEEFLSLTNEHKLLKEKYENHPEVLATKIEVKRVQDELEQYRNFYDMGEKDVLLEEIQDLRTQLQSYMNSSAMSARKRSSLQQLTYSCEPSLAPPLCTISERTEDNAMEKFEQERHRWTEAESEWISLAEELKNELEASRSLADKWKQELDSEKKCAEEMKEAMQMFMEGHARMLEQYAELEEKHIALLARHRKIREGIDDVKKAAAKAGVRGAESKFINALAAEISALKVEREKERRYFRDENKGLQAQLRDTAEAVQAAGELLVRLKEAEEAVAAAQDRAIEAEKETERAYAQIRKLKKQERGISAASHCLAENCLPKQKAAYEDSDMAKYDVAGEPQSAGDQQWREEFEPFYNGKVVELSKLEEPSSWFSGYDRCNI